MIQLALHDKAVLENNDKPRHVPRVDLQKGEHNG